MALRYIDCDMLLKVRTTHSQGQSDNGKHQFTPLSVRSVGRRKRRFSRMMHIPTVGAASPRASTARRKALAIELARRTMSCQLAASSVTRTDITRSTPREARANGIQIAQETGRCPESHLLQLLQQRGRPAQKVSSKDAGYQFPPTKKQIDDYDSRPFLTDLVRRGDIKGLQKAVTAGKRMDASNKFGESVVHVACRRGDIAVLRFLLDNGGSLTSCDDLGRFPLHEVCWAAEPSFDIVRLFLDCGSPDLLLVTDKRGCTPLRYAKQELWPLWCKFLEDVADQYWPPVPNTADHHGGHANVVKTDTDTSVRNVVNDGGGVGSSGGDGGDAVDVDVC